MTELVIITRHKKNHKPTPTQPTPKTPAELWRTTRLPKCSMSSGDFLNKLHHLTMDGHGMEEARTLTRTMFAEVFPNEAWPTTKTWKQIIRKVAYEIQIKDWKSDGRIAGGEILKRYLEAQAYIVPKEAEADAWGLDGTNYAPSRKAGGKSTPSGKKGALKRSIDELLTLLSSGQAELEVGVGTKGHTIMKGTAEGHVQVLAKKDPTTYNLEVEYDRKVLFNRIMRWSRKEDIFAC